MCRNPVCPNRKRFILDVSKSRFVDFQKVRVQEMQHELPRGSIPRSLEVILRAEAVDTAQPGDKCDFIGTLIVVPDVGQMQMAGAQAEPSQRCVRVGPVCCVYVCLCVFVCGCVGVSTWCVCMRAGERACMCACVGVHACVCMHV